MKSNFHFKFLNKEGYTINFESSEEDILNRYNMLKTHERSSHTKVIKIFATLFLILFLSCNLSSQDIPARTKCRYMNWKPYLGKTVKWIEYCGDCGPSGDLLHIHFTDGTKLSIYAYKYQMEIQH